MKGKKMGTEAGARWRNRQSFPYVMFRIAIDKHSPLYVQLVRVLCEAFWQSEWPELGLVPSHLWSVPTKFPAAAVGSLVVLRSVLLWWKIQLEDVPERRETTMSA